MSRDNYRLVKDLLNSDLVLPAIKPNTISLNNNIKLYIFDNKDLEINKIEFFFHNAGSINQDKTFTSKITNNQINEGSKNYTSKQIADAIDYHGAFIDKYVDKESASLSFYFLNKYTDNMIHWIEEIIKNPIFPEKELEILKPKLKNEFLVNQQKTDFLARNFFYQKVFGKDNPYGIIGSLEDYDKIERNDLIEFYNRYYSSNQLSIILSGAYNEKLIESISITFGGEDWTGVNKGSNTIKPIEFIPQLPSKEIIHLKNSVQASICIGKTIISNKHEDYFGLKVLNTVLGGYFGSRLMSNIREDKGYTYGIGSILHSFSDIGLFLIVGDVKAEFCQKAIDEIYKEIDLLSTQLIDQEELDTVKNYMIGQLLRSLDGCLELGERFRPILKYNLDYSYYQDYLKEIIEIDSEKIINLAGKYFSFDSLTEIRSGNETIII